MDVEVTVCGVAHYRESCPHGWSRNGGRLHILSRRPCMAAVLMLGRPTSLLEPTPPRPVK
ncbi:hypothetical protein [Streptomyces odonnellii]|uniref:hypothetical protein n=1 Tax=Streptomyces odonnellii TaxID=1417980 RepID=UPI0012FF0C75|nr:hypothetical protein [Streptomyces odonnellii]